MVSSQKQKKHPYHIELLGFRPIGCPPMVRFRGFLCHGNIIAFFIHYNFTTRHQLQVSWTGEQNENCRGYNFWNFFFVILDSCFTNVHTQKPKTDIRPIEYDRHLIKQKLSPRSVMARVAALVIWWWVGGGSRLATETLFFKYFFM
jgi:hypothetical protein